MHKPIILYCLIFTAFIFYHLLTLSISPIVWIDEIPNNSKVLDFILNGTFHFNADKTWDWGGGKAFAGPVYYVLNSFIISAFGNGVFQSRLLELAAGLLIIFFISKNYAFRKLNLWQLLIFICFLFDPFFSSEMHRGRFDLLAVLFCLLSVNSLIGSPVKSLNQKKAVTYFSSIASGLFYGVSILTHIRLAFFAPVFFALFLVEWLQNKNERKNIFYKSVAWAVGVGILFFPWIYFHFGGIGQYIDEYTLLMKRAPIFVGSEWMILPEVLPLFLIFITFSGIFLLNYKYFANSRWPLACFSMIAVFFTLIRDTGHYSILVIPCFYLLIFLVIEFYDQYKKIYRLAIAGGTTLLFIVYTGIFIMKSNVLITDYPARDPAALNQFISQHIPACVRVCTDEYYYFSVLKNKNDLHLFYSFQAEANKAKKDSLFIEIEKYSRVKFDYDYLVISDITQWLRPELFELYKGNGHLQAIARFDPPATPLPASLSFLSVKNIGKTGYNGTIYKRIRE